MHVGTIEECVCDKLLLDPHIEYAVKVFGGDGSAALHEFELARRMDRIPFILSAYTLVEEDPAHTHTHKRGIVLPLCKHGDLHSVVCGMSRGLTVEEVLNVFTQVVLGVAALHAGGVLHLDIKPQNILVKSLNGRGAPEDVCVCDLGVARVAQDGTVDAATCCELESMYHVYTYVCECVESKHPPRCVCVTSLS